MPVSTPKLFAMRFAAITTPPPPRPPPPHTGRPRHSGWSAISQLAKKLSPSTCRMRVGALALGMVAVPFDNFTPKDWRCQPRCGGAIGKERENGQSVERTCLEIEKPQGYYNTRNRP